MADNRQIAATILDRIGGKGNVIQAMHCMTRLRVILKTKNVDVEDLKSIDGVIGAQYSGEQLQIIIGPKVQKVYAEFIELAEIQEEKPIDENLEEKTSEKTGFNKILDGIFGYISGAMTPIIGIFIAAGLIKTINAIFGPSLLGWITEESDLYTLFTFVGDAGMYFLPIFLGVSASIKLNVNWGIGAYLGAIMLHPTFVEMATNGTKFSVYGIPANVQNYSSSVMPILLSVWVMSYIEKGLKKYIPDALQVLAVPVVTVLVMTPLELCILGPAGAYLSNYLCGGIIALNDIAGPLATMLIGALFLLIVFTGMHSILYVYLFTTFPTLGYDSFFLPGVVAASWTIAGCCLAAVIKFKDKKQRSFVISSFIAWIIGGVGEPFMYGLILPRKKLLFACCIAGGIAGLVAGITGLTAYVLAPNNGVYGLFAFIGGSTWNYIALILTVAASVIASFIACMLLKIQEDS